MLKRLLLILILCLAPLVSYAAISYVGVTNSASDTNSVTTLTTAVTVSAGTDRALAVCVQARGAPAGSAVSGVTFNGSETFTLAKAQSFASGGATFRAELWYLTNPTVTTANVVVTWPNTNNNQVQAYSVVQANGVDPSAALDSTSGAGADSATISSIITTTSDNALIIDCSLTGQTLSPSVGANQTSRVNRALATTGVQDRGLTSTTAKTPAGAETMDWTQTSERWAQVAASFVPSGGAQPPSSAPTQATLAWTNGTDTVGGSGVTTAIIKRCTGSCVPTTTLTTVPASNGTAGSYVDNTLAANTTYNWCIANADAAGNQSACVLAGSGATTGTTYRRIQFIDNFDRADNTDLNASWDAGYTAVNNAKIVSNRVRSTVVNTDSVETYNGFSGADTWAQYTVPTLTGAVQANVNVLVRFAAPGQLNGYICTTNVNAAHTFSIYKVVNSVYTELSFNNTATYQASDIYRCEAEGTTIRFFQVRGTAETLLTSVTDATFASGRTGLQIFITAAGSLVNAELDNFAMGDFTSTPPTPPTIDSVTVDPTGANVVWNLTTPPTKIRVDCGTNSQAYLNDIVPIASFPGGRYTYPWPDGLTYCGFHAINNLDVETTLPTTTYQYKNMVGVVQPLDTTPPVVSNCVPTTDLPFGTTSWVIECDINKPATGKYDTVDTTYALMANNMTTQSLKISATVTGLTNGSTNIYKVRAQSTDALAVDVYPTTTSQTITVHVLAGAGADTTAPTTPTNLAAQLQGQSAVLVWTASTDAGGLFGYQVYQSTDNITFTVAGNPVTATTTQIALFPNNTYYWKVLAIDNANNVSSFSSTVSLTTPSTPDVTPPSKMANLRIIDAFTQSLLLGWDTGTDDLSIVTSSIEQCLVIAPATDCSNFSQVSSAIAFQSLTVLLSPATSYCFRGRHTDAAGNAGLYSDVVCATTLTLGLPKPRDVTAFGLDRSVVSIARPLVSIPRAPRQAY